MKALLAILKREFLAYFFSPLAYVVLTAFLFINGYVFYAILLSLNSPETSRQELMALFFKNVFYWIFMMLVSSIVAMRLIAEERKSGSIEALLTAPVGEGTVVTGKFLGGFSLLRLPVAPDGPLPGRALALRKDRLRADRLGLPRHRPLRSALHRRGDLRLVPDEEPDHRGDRQLRDDPRDLPGRDLPRARHGPEPEGSPLLPEPDRAHGRLRPRASSTRAASSTSSPPSSSSSSCPPGSCTGTRGNDERRNGRSPASTSPSPSSSASGSWASSTGSGHATTGGSTGRAPGSTRCRRSRHRS